MGIRFVRRPGFVNSQVDVRNLGATAKPDEVCIRLRFGIVEEEDTNATALGVTDIALVLAVVGFNKELEAVWDSHLHWKFYEGAGDRNVADDAMHRRPARHGRDGPPEALAAGVLASVAPGVLHQEVTLAGLA